MVQKPTLGKGLASLFPGSSPHPHPSAAALFPPPQDETPPPSPPPLISSSGAQVPQHATPHPESTAATRYMGITLALLDDITANSLQPRRDFDDQALEELAASIRVHGLIQPLIVRKNATRGFELVAGERRLRAAKMAGLKQVPVVIRKSTDRESLEVALIENIQRSDLNCIDEALAYFQLIKEFGLTQEELATRVGKDRASVANHLRLLRLPEAVIEDLKQQRLSLGHGKAILSLESMELRLQVRKLILEQGLSVRATEVLIDRLKTEGPTSDPADAQMDPPTTPPENALQLRLNNLSRELERQWSTKVEVRGTASKGKFLVHYSNAQEFERLLEKFQMGSA